jgi:chromosome segregation ATPase
MDAYKKSIEELERRIQRSSAEIRTQLKKLGEYLSYQEQGAFSATEMSDLYGRIQDLRGQLPKSRQQVKRILQCVNQNEQLEQEISEKKRQIAGLEEANQAICEEIGRAAFEAYKSLSSGGNEYSDLFEPLIKQERELTELESEYSKLQGHGKDGNFFRIFRETGRSLYLKGILSLKKKAIGKIYREAGKRLCESQFGAELKSSGLDRVLGPYKDNDRKIKALKQEVSKLRNVQERIWNELKELGADRSHQKRVREIEIGIQRIEEELEDAFEGFGSLFRSQPAEHFGDDAEVARALKQIEVCEETKKRGAKQIERIEAALLIDNLQRQARNLNQRISRLEEEVRLRRGEIDTLKAQVAEGENEINRLIKIRGSEQSLLKISREQERGEGQK